MIKEFEVKIEDKNLRLDLFLLKNLTQSEINISRTFIKNLIDEGRVTLNKGILKPNYKVKLLDKIVVDLILPKGPQVNPEKINLNILYEDDDIIIVNKPAGLVVHPGAGNLTGTLVNALLNHTKNLSTINPLRPGIVHRLDKDTSGLMVVAKNNKAHLYLIKQFSKHDIKKLYIAVVKGKVEFDEGVIDIPIMRHTRDRKKMSVGFTESAKEAKTFYKVIKRTGDYSILELTPYTGRTHQLRVHLAYLGYPILGDKKYAKSKDNCRLMLHAKLLGFIHPATKEEVEFSTKLPEEFIKLM